MKNFIIIIQILIANSVFGFASPLTLPPNIIIYENANYQGRSKVLEAGRHRFLTPQDFNDVISSIKIPQGVIVIASESANEVSGYGQTLILDKDTPLLSVLNDNISNIIVMAKEGISFSKLPKEHLEDSQDNSDVFSGSDGNFYTVSSTGEVILIEVEGKSYTKANSDASNINAFILPWKIKKRKMSFSLCFT